MSEESQLTREQAFLRISAVCLVVGSVAVVAFRTAHGDLPTETGGAALRYVAARPIYPLVHLSDTLGFLIFAGGLFVLSDSQPGEQWLYDTGSNILGVLIARVSGQTFGTFLRERIFEPLGMQDTGFSVPEAQLDRLPTCYWTPSATGGLVVFDEARGGRFSRPPTFESGAGGLVSTVDDYLAFCLMLLNQGRHASGRLLSRPSVELMTTDHITPAQKAVSAFMPGFWDNRGWGFGLSIITRRDDLAGTPGRFGWDGGYGASAYTDPREELVAISMTQRLMDSPRAPELYSDFWTSVYQAIDD